MEDCKSTIAENVSVHVKNPVMGALLTKPCIPVSGPEHNFS